MLKFPSMPKFSKMFEGAFKQFDKAFEDFDKAFEDINKDMNQTKEQLDKELYELDNMKSGDEKETVREERKPDGTVIITRTIIRKSSG